MKRLASLESKSVTGVQMSKWWAVFGVVLATAAAGAQPTGIQAKAEWLFESSSSFFDRSMPVIVEITNNGPDAEGELSLESSTGYDLDKKSAVTQISLPTGSRKEVVLSVYESYISADRVLVRLNRGSFTIPLIAPQRAASGSPVLIITDSPGEFGFLEQASSGGPQGLVPSYVLVARAPDRYRTYESTRAVVLSEGTEKLRDSVVIGLKQYVLAGGSLVFMGSAGGSAIDDPRWADLAPIRNRRPKSREKPGNLTFGGSPINRPVTVWEGETAPESRAISPEIIQRTFGLGTVTYFSVDLLAAPLDQWSSRAKFFQRGIRSVSAGNGISRLKSLITNPYNDPNGYASGPALQAPVPASDSPFRLALPASETVWWILVIYAVLVGPVNFLVLRRKNRVELAWVTAPLISILFAGIFLIRALPLYRTPLTTRVMGTLIEQAGKPGAMFAGKAEMFFPVGGTYNLKLKNTELITTELNYRQQGNAIEELVDRGALEVTRFRVSNLAFESIGLIELLPNTQILEGEAWKDPKGIKIAITNVSPYTLEDIQFRDGLRGSSHTLKPGDALSEVIPGFADITPRMKVSGEIMGLRLGPQLGDFDESSSEIRFESFVSVRVSTP